MIRRILRSCILLSVISAESLQKHYGRIAAVDGLSLNVEKGTVTALIGPNGAGKTTTIKMILGILRPDKGAVTVLGQNPWDNPHIRKHVGVVYERANFPSHQRIQSYLERVARIFGVPESRAGEVLTQVGLSDANTRSVKALSAGMLQKFAIAHALIHRPEIIIADEPTSNLDPQARTEILDLVSSLSKNGTTFLISSHILPELSRVCDAVAIVNKGKVWASGKLSDLYTKFGANSLRVGSDRSDLLLPKIRELDYVLGVDIDGQGLSVRVKEGSDSRLYEDAPRLAKDAGAKIFGIESRSASLEELFRQAVQSN